MNKEVLIALLKEKSDFAILQDQGWYRIPVEHKPKRWPPEWLALYMPASFKEHGFSIRYYGKVKEINTVTRRELFPNEFESGKSDNLYFRIKLEKLEELPNPILSFIPRRILFVATTLDKFHHAEEFNDLFDESKLEDELWHSMKSAKILAERQWEIIIQKYKFQLDFAVFCKEGQIDIEADGDTWHAKRKRIDKDNNRNNTLASAGWRVLRFNGKQIHENQAKVCLGKIETTINKLGGLSSDGLVPRKFYPGSEGGQQLSLFDEKADYDVDLD